MGTADSAPSMMSAGVRLGSTPNTRPRLALRSAGERAQTGTPQMLVLPRRAARHSAVAASTATMLRRVLTRTATTPAVPESCRAIASSSQQGRSPRGQPAGTDRSQRSPAPRVRPPCAVARGGGHSGTRLVATAAHPPQCWPQAAASSRCRGSSGPADGCRHLSRVAGQWWLQQRQEKGRRSSQQVAVHRLRQQRQAGRRRKAEARP